MPFQVTCALQLLHEPHVLFRGAEAAAPLAELPTPCLRAGSPGSRVRAFAASADLDRAVIVLFDSSISVWELVSMSLACVLQTRGERDANFGHTSGVNGVAITRDGSQVVTVSKDETARVWNVDSGMGVHVLRGEASGSCASPDARLPMRDVQSCS